MREVFGLLLFACFAEATIAEAAGTMSMVGGYSNHRTIGIVTQVEDGAFIIRGTSFAAEPLKVGTGVEDGDRLWVEANGLTRLADSSGSRVTIAGPAIVEIKSKGIWHVFRGSIKFKSADGAVVQFTHPVMSAKVVGEAALWATEEETQLLSLAGDVQTWHPKLANSITHVPPGFFSEASAHAKQLQPTRPQRTDDKLFRSFLARFEKSPEDKVDSKVVAIRGLASEKKPLVTQLIVTRGSRARSDVIESQSEDVLDRMKSRMAGKDEDDIDDRPLAAPGVRRDAYGRPIRSIRSLKRGLASSHVQGPHIEVVKEAPKPSDENPPEGERERYYEKQKLLKKLRKLGDRIELK